MSESFKLIIRIVYRHEGGLFSFLHSRFVLMKLATVKRSGSLKHIYNHDSSFKLLRGDSKLCTFFLLFFFFFTLRGFLNLFPWFVSYLQVCFLFYFPRLFTIHFFFGPTQILLLPCLLGILLALYVPGPCIINSTRGKFSVDKSSFTSLFDF